MENQLSEMFQKTAIVRAGLFCCVVIAFALISLFTYSHLVGSYHVEPFLTLNELVITISLSLVAYGLSIGMTISLLPRLNRFLSDFTLVSGFGSILFGAAMACFLYFDTLIDLQQYRELSFRIFGTAPRPVLPTIEDLSVYSASFAITSFVSVNVLHSVFRSSRSN